ncbi:uncharacterized protein LOC125942749 isoform X2 [Dermacentor silvarum]|nr:uncharacterized protein LOC125942749 isoform X2 [Dermacentor silvarum]
MKMASVGTKSPAKASSKAQGDVLSRASGAEPSGKVQRAYSPPCTRSQIERFAKQLKFYEQLPEKRMSRHARDRPKLKAVENRRQDDAGKHGQKQMSPTKNGQEDEASREEFS